MIKREINKFVVQAALIVRDGREITGEDVSEPVTLYGIKGLRAWADNFEAEVEKMNRDTT